MRNQFRKPKKCELRHSIFLKETILKVKLCERSERSLTLTLYERR